MIIFLYVLGFYLPHLGYAECRIPFYFLNCNTPYHFRGRVSCSFHHSASTFLLPLHVLAVLLNSLHYSTYMYAAAAGGHICRRLASPHGQGSLFCTLYWFDPLF